MLSDIPRMLAIVERLMQKKSLAAMPIVYQWSNISSVLSIASQPLQPTLSSRNPP